MESTSQSIPRGRSICVSNHTPDEGDLPAASSGRIPDATIALPPATETATDIDDKSLKRKLPYRAFLTPSGMLLLAVALAGAHHFHYSFLNHQMVGSPSRQQWSIRIGTGLAWTVVALLKVVAGSAYVQLLFWLLRKKAIPMRDIDALFDLRKADPSAFLAKGVWRKAFLLVPFASIIMSVSTLPIAAIFPPSTLSTMSAIGPQQKLPSLNWTLDSPGCTYKDADCSVKDLESLVRQVYFSGRVLNFFRPTTDTSYQFTFVGPSMSCVAPNATQQLAFDHYAETSALKNLTYTASTLDMANSTDISIRYYSAFVLQEPRPGYQTELGDLYKYNYGYGNEEIKSQNTSQLWIQLFDENLVCTLVAADFDIRITFDANYQMVTHQNYTLREVIPITETVDWNSMSFTMLADFSMGDVNLRSSSSGTIGEVYSQSGLMTTDLTTCLASNLDSISKHLPNMTLSERLWGLLQLGNSKKRSQVCPTGTLSTGLMELMNNVTISMITSDNPAYVILDQGASYAYINRIKNLTIFATADNQLIYIYNIQELIASYAVAILVVSMVFVAGLFAISRNGMVHDSSFSAMVAVTRNPKLDAMFAGENMSGYPLTPLLYKQKLRFGALRSTCGCNKADTSHDKDCSMTAAFGTENEIEPLQLKNWKA